MLWRANLYIDEGVEDWNNAHPWNAPASGSTGGPAWRDDDGTQTADQRWGNNDWNKVVKYNQIDASVESESASNGGQISISSWSRFVGPNNEWDVYNSVAYGYGCGDKLEEFNKGLMEQSAAMSQMKENNPNYPPAGTFTEGQTTAPDSDWKYYIFPADTNQYKYGNQKLLGKEPSAFYKRTAEEKKVKIPGFSTYWLSKNEYNSAQCKYTLGIDCSGLVHRSSIYEDSKYATTNKTIHEINAKMVMGKKYSYTNANNEAVYVVETNPTYSIPLFAASDTNKWILNSQGALTDKEIEKRDKQRIILSHAVPGDILVNDGHVVFIQNLNYPDDSMLITDFNQVDVIHSTSGIENQFNTWKVHKGTWFQIHADNEKNSTYQLRRLKITEE